MTTSIKLSRTDVGALIQNRKTHYSSIILHHWFLVSSIAALDPGLCRTDHGIEQRPLGHSSDHGAPIIRGRANIADRLASSAAMAADFLGQLFGQHLAF